LALALNVIFDFINLTPLIPLSFGGRVKERGKIKRRGFAPLKHPADIKDKFDKESSLYI
jgi:hypothetical protein